MSRAYWVKLSSSVSETVNAHDKAIHKIDLDTVVPEGEMNEILKGALEEGGWEKSDGKDNTYEKDVEGVRLSWDLDEMTVEAQVEGSETVSRDIAVEGRGYDRGTARREAERMLQQEEDSARDAIQAETDRLQRELSKQLDENEQKRVREINGVLQRTYAEGLKRKAGRMGNVTSINESTNPDGEYQLTITIAE
ncbi:MAG: hypothetical protein CMH57_14620 [Myxococcales bacterium]|nr:hypothetical protein [Myxococcales bacterium]